MNRFKMLCTGDYNKEWFEKFGKYFDMDLRGFCLSDGSKMIVLSENELIDSFQNKEVALIGYDKVTRNVLKNSPDLKVILSVRDGPEENIDIPACTELGIPVISSAGRCATSVSEFTFMLMLLLARPMIPVIERIRKEGWTKDNNSSLRSMYAHRSTELFHKKLGLIGFGRNAKALAKIANVFNMSVSAYDPYVSKKDMEEHFVQKEGLADLVRSSDYVIVLARLSKETEGMLNRDLIFSMKSTASIINTGRAKLIDNEAVLDALELGVIKSAALDVHDPEPLGELDKNRIYKIPEDKLIITSHAAGVTEERTWHQYDLLYQQVLDVFHGVIPSGCVNKEVFETKAFKERNCTLFNWKGIE